MPPKRRHTKSRNGCMTCRRRRVKCDEIHPTCTNCTRRELDCVWAAYCPPGRPGTSSQTLSPRSRLTQTSTRKPPHKSTTATPISVAEFVRRLEMVLLDMPPPVGSPMSRFHLDNLNFLHHFTTFTWKSLTNTEPVHDIWQVYVPQIALENDFLMHAILAVSALHLSSMSSGAEYYQITAATHYDRAVRSLRTEMADRSPQRGGAYFATSALISIYFFTCRAAANESSNVPRIFTWLPLARGVNSIMREFCAGIKDSCLAPLMTKGTQGRIIEVNHVKLPESLAKLTLESSDPDDEADDKVAETYKVALELLKNTWNHFWVENYPIASGFEWPMTLPKEFIPLLRQGRPRALVLFCYYLCIIKKLDGFWWIRGAANEAFDKIELKLNKKWRDKWLEWPMDIIRGNALEPVGPSYRICA